MYAPGPTRCMAAVWRNSADVEPVGNILPGLNKLFVANAGLRAAIASMSASVNIKRHVLLLFHTDAVFTGKNASPTSTQSSRISPPILSAFSVSPGLRSSNSTEGWRFPSPAWRRLAIGYPVRL